MFEELNNDDHPCRPAAEVEWWELRIFGPSRKSLGPGQSFGWCCYHVEKDFFYHNHYLFEQGGGWRIGCSLGGSEGDKSQRRGWVDDEGGGDVGDVDDGDDGDDGDVDEGDDGNGDVEGWQKLRKPLSQI